MNPGLGVESTLSESSSVQSQLAEVMRHRSIRCEQGLVKGFFCCFFVAKSQLQKNPFANPCSHRIAGCLITSADWLWTVLHPDNVDSFPTQFLNKFRRSTTVGDETPDSLVGANL